MEAIECIKTRRSIRKYEDKPVDRSLIEEIIEIARFAPSWKNSKIRLPANVLWDMKAIRITYRAHLF